VRKKYQYHRCSCTPTIKDVCRLGNPKSLEAGLWRKDKVFLILYMEILCEYWLLCQTSISTYSHFVSLLKYLPGSHLTTESRLLAEILFGLPVVIYAHSLSSDFWCHKFCCPVHILILLKIKSLHQYFESQKCICLFILSHFLVWYLKQRDSCFSCGRNLILKDHELFANNFLNQIMTNIPTSLAQNHPL